MALGDTYATLDELKSYLNLQGQSGLDNQLADALQSATSEINRHTHRQFNQDTTLTVRVFEAFSCEKVYVDDFWTTTGLVVKTDLTGDAVFEATWAASDYEVFPLNGMVNSEPWPYFELRRTASNYFPQKQWTTRGTAARVQITAKWGWPSVPAPVKQACLMLAAENFQLKDAPLGVAGMGEFGVIRVRNNKMVEAKLAKYTIDEILVG